MEDDGVASAQGKESINAKSESEELKGWSTRVEDLLDKGDGDGAVKLLKKVVETLQLSEDADTNLGLAAALNDLGEIYASQGLSLLSDECLTSALLIKQRASRKPPEESPESWESFAELSLEAKGSDKSNKGAGQSRASIEDYYRRDAPPSGDYTSSSTRAGREEEDWEAAVVEPPTVAKLSTASTKQDTPSSERNVKQKQRGRGSFTYGGAGMYSDNLDVAAGDEDDRRDGTLVDHSLDVGADHVLVISGFSPKVKTKDLEDLVKPFAKAGSCTLRWIDDTTTLAVFRTPTMARAALTGITDPRFKISVYDESSHAYGMASRKDLQPPSARPASSARVAQRMIAGALGQQGVRQALIAKVKTNSEEVKKQEKERRARLQTRAQLRDEAWGSDDDN